MNLQYWYYYHYAREIDKNLDLEVKELLKTLC